MKEEVEKQTKELMEEKARKEKQLEESNKKLAASNDILKSLRLNVNVVVRNILGVRSLTSLMRESSIRPLRFAKKRDHV